MNTSESDIVISGSGGSAELAGPQSPAPNDPPWNGWVAVGVWLLSILLIIFIPNLFVLPYVASQAISFSDPATLKQFLLSDKTAIILQLIPIVIAHVITLVLAWIVVTRFNRYSFRDTLGWRFNGFKFWHAGVIFVCFYAIAIGATLAFGDVENDFEKLIRSSRTAVYLVAFFATVTAPLVEEVVYRGLLYSAFQRTVGVAGAVMLVTLLFTLVHVPQYSLENVPDYATILTLLLLSLALTVLRAVTGNLLPCIVLHTVINGIQSVLLIAEPYLPTSAPLPDPGAFIVPFIK